MGFDPESGNGGSSKVTPPPLATAFVHVQAQLFMSEIAAAIGETADAARFTAAHAKLKAAFHARFYDPEAGGYAPCVDAVPSALRCPTTALLHPPAPRRHHCPPRGSLDGPTYELLAPVRPAVIVLPAAAAAA